MPLPTATTKRSDVWIVKEGENPAEFNQLTFLVQLLVYLLAFAHLVIVGRPMVVTAFIDTDGGHSENGKHPLGRAFDVRAKDKTDQQKAEFWAVGKLLAGLMGGLPLWEAKGTTNEHFHFGV